MIKFFNLHNKKENQALTSWVRMFHKEEISVIDPKQFRICLLKDEEVRKLKDVFDSLDPEES